MTTRLGDGTTCSYCHQEIFLFDKAPTEFAREDGAGWALDYSGDIQDDFICNARESTGRWPNGKPHDPVSDDQVSFPDGPKRDWTPLVNSNGRRTLLGEWMDELEARCSKSAEALEAAAETQGTSPMGMARAVHLTSKAMGVRLALSYVQEMKRRR